MWPGFTPTLTSVCSFSAPWSISSHVGDREGPHRRAVVWQCWCTRRGWGTRGLLFHSAVDVKRSFSQSVCNSWVSKALAWCLLASWGPKFSCSCCGWWIKKLPTICFTGRCYSHGTAGEVVTLQKPESDHGAAGMEEMLSQMVCSSLGQDFSPAEEVSQYWFNVSPVMVTDRFGFGFCQRPHNSMTTSL